MVYFGVTSWRARPLRITPGHRIPTGIGIQVDPTVVTNRVAVDEAAVPLKLTTVAPVSPEPAMVIVAPTAPDVGVKPVMAGTGTTVKMVALVAVPPAVDTVIRPVVAPEGTGVVIVVAESLVGDAAVPLNATVALPRFAPEIVTVVAVEPVEGENDVMVGGGITVKLVELVTVPPGVVRLIFPLVAPDGTVAETVVRFAAENVAATPLKLTADVPVNVVPVMVTVAPTGPEIGVKDAIVGGATMVKLVALVATPPGVVMLSFPLVVPVATMAVTVVAPFTLKVVAAVPLKLTAVAPFSPVPVIVTVPPIGPDEGVKLVIVGTGATVKLLALVAVPPAVLTSSFPEVAPGGTRALISDCESL